MSDPITITLPDGRTVRLGDWKSAPMCSPCWLNDQYTCAATHVVRKRAEKPDDFLTYGVTHVGPDEVPVCDQHAEEARLIHTACGCTIERL